LALVKLAGLLRFFCRLPFRAQQLGDAPVHDERFAERPDHHVLGLEVAVDHAVGVGERDRLADPLEEPERGAEVAVLLDPDVEAIPLHELHHVIGAAVRELAEVVDGDDDGMLEPSRGALPTRRRTA
jgi:hypothetical protein